MGARLSRYLQCGPAARARTAAAAAGGATCERGLRRRRCTISIEAELATERRLYRSPAAPRALGVLRTAAIHAEYHTRQHGFGGIFAERASIRSRGMRRSNH